MGLTIQQANKEYQKLIKIDKNGDKRINIHDFKKLPSMTLYEYTKLFADDYFTYRRALDIKYIRYLAADIDDNNKIDENELQFLQDMLSTYNKILKAKKPLPIVKKLEEKIEKIKDTKIKKLYLRHVPVMYSALGIREYFKKEDASYSVSLEKRKTQKINKLYIDLKKTDALIKKLLKQKNALLQEAALRQGLQITDRLLSFYFSSKKSIQQNIPVIRSLLGRKAKYFSKILSLNPLSLDILKSYVMFNIQFRANLSKQELDNYESLMHLAEDIRLKKKNGNFRDRWVEAQLTVKKNREVLRLIKNKRFQTYQGTVTLLKKLLKSGKLKKEEVPLVLHILFNQKFEYSTNKKVLSGLLSPRAFFASAEKQKGKGVCDEWAYAFSSILNDLNIANYFCVGRRNSQYGHAFSLFKIGSRWYIFQESGIGKFSYKNIKEAFRYIKKDQRFVQMYYYYKGLNPVKKDRKKLAYKDSDNNTLYLILHNSQKKIIVASIN